MIYYCFIVDTNGKIPNFAVSFPEFRGVHTQGNSERHALEMAKQTLQDTIQYRIENNDDIPDTVDHSCEGLFPIELDENIVRNIVRKQMEILRKKMVLHEDREPEYRSKGIQRKR